jgi:hypothetical protein
MELTDEQLALLREFHVESPVDYDEGLGECRWCEARATAFTMDSLVHEPTCLWVKVGEILR